ncbi:MAG: Gfo/Idh/MocA family oxidoreductase [Puniceicoccales bacterium]|nr:Gfo/Idh/MocA family oxidoreductase [Puniceicoccales bacterium]
MFPTIVSARALGRDGGVAPSNRIVLGLVGASQGMVNLSRFLPFPDVQVVAVCDVDTKRRENATRRVNTHYQRDVARGWRDFREMFARANLDAVILAAPDHWHAVMAVAALRAGLDVFGEKPLAHTLAEGRAIVDAVRRHGRVWQTGSWQRSISTFRRAVELVRSGCVGKISRIEVGTYGGIPSVAATPANIGKPPAGLDYEMWVGPAAWTDYDPRVTHLRWRYVLNYGGGRLMDFVGHHVDIAQWALGCDGTGPVRFSGKGEFATTPPYDAERNYRFVCTYANGMEMAVSSALQPGIKFYGERGWLYVGRARGINGAASLKASDPAILNETPDSGAVNIRYSDNHWRDFLECVKTRAETVSPAESGHRSASIGHLGHIAVLTGREIRWDPATETIRDDESASALLRPVFRGQWGI